MSKSDLQLKLDELAQQLGLDRAPDWMPWERGVRLTFDQIIPPDAMSDCAAAVFVNVGMMHHQRVNGASTLTIFDLPLE